MKPNSTAAQCLAGLSRHKPGGANRFDIVGRKAWVVNNPVGFQAREKAVNTEIPRSLSEVIRLASRRSSLIDRYGRLEANVPSPLVYVRGARLSSGSKIGSCVRSVKQAVTFPALRSTGVRSAAQSSVKITLSQDSSVFRLPHEFRHGVLSHMRLAKGQEGRVN